MMIPTQPLILMLRTAALIVCAALPAHAGDEGLYGPAAPPGSAFVRLFNDGPAPVRGSSVGDKALDDLDAYEASEFVFLPAGAYPLRAGGASQTVTLKPSRYYTAVLSGGKVQVVENEPWSNRLKALVVVYNLLEGDAMDLRTPDGKPVVERVAAGGTAAREVNAVRAGFAVFQGNQKLMDVQPVNLQRGKAFSLFIAGTRDRPMPVWVIS